MSHTALIIDDESLARQVIRNYLKAYPDIQIIGECNNGQDAVKQINSQKPDIVFLDIQMPELNGIEVIERLQYIPMIIFSTAFDEYAIKAFEINAVDYLLKPYDEHRFKKSIQRVQKQLRSDSRDLQQLASLVQSFNDPQEYLERILLPCKDRMVFVNVKDIILIEAVENYVSLFTLNESHLLLQKISDIEDKLNPKHFFRIHRSYIVNLDFVESIHTWKKSGYRVRLKNGKELPLGRRRVKTFKLAFGL
jgi:two-component system LytT family response regulator